MKVGTYSIPDNKLHPTLVEAIKKIYEKFRSNEATNRLTVAKLIGHNSVSGPFNVKIANLRTYGLIEKRGIIVTNIGKQLTYGATEEDKNQALKEAVLNVPLWKEFYSRWGVNPPTEDFWVDLGTITGLEAPDAQRIAKKVRKAYLSDVSHLKLEKEPKTRDNGMGSSDAVDAFMIIPEGVLGRVTVQGYGIIDVKDKTSYEIAKAYLKLMAEQLSVAVEEG